MNKNEIESLKYNLELLEGDVQRNEKMIDHLIRSNSSDFNATVCAIEIKKLIDKLYIVEKQAACFHSNLHVEKKQGAFFWECSDCGANIKYASKRE